MIRGRRQTNFVTLSSILADYGGHRHGSTDFLFSVEDVRKSIFCENRRPPSLRVPTQNRSLIVILKNRMFRSSENFMLK